MSEPTNPNGNDFVLPPYTLGTPGSRRAHGSLSAECRNLSRDLAPNIVCGILGNSYAASHHELYLRSATRTLQQFDERTLADIGLRRAEIEHAVRNGRLASAEDNAKTG